MKSLLRRVLPAAAGGALVVPLLSACGPTDITAQRLEHSIAVVFPNYYVQQQARLGHPGVDPNAVHPLMSCDRGGPNNPDKGAGNDWICQADWTDPVKNVHYTDLDPSTGATKFEIKVNSDACYTAGGSSKVFGPQQLTDTSGKIFDNPMFEFDGCFNTDDNRTGTTKAAIPEPAATAATSPSASPSPSVTPSPSSSALPSPTATPSTSATPSSSPSPTTTPVRTG